MPLSSFLALAAAVFAAAFAYGAVMPLLPELLAPLVSGAPTASISWHAGAFASSYMFAVVLFSPLWGTVSDRLGTKSILLLGLAGSAVAAAVLAFAQDLWEAYLWRVLQGVFASASLPVAASALARIADTVERARKVAALGAASLLGFFAAPSVSATLVSRELAAPVTSALYASALVALGAFVVLAALFRTEAGRRLPGMTGAKQLPLRFLGLNLLAYLGLGAFEVALPLAAPGPLAVDPVQVSLLFVECSLMMLVAQGTLMWAARFRAQFPKLLVATIAAYCAGLLALASAGSFSAALWAVGLVAASSGLLLPLIGFLATLEIGDRPGAALGRLTAAGGLGQAIGSISGGVLYAQAGMSIFTTTAFVLGVGALVASPLPRWLRRSGR
jgi:MFS family permease